MGRKWKTRWFMANKMYNDVLPINFEWISLVSQSEIEITFLKYFFANRK